MSSFKRVGIVARRGNPAILDTVAALVQFLRERAVDVVLEESTAPLIDGSHERVARSAMGSVCDLVVVVGGDGSLLGVARDLAPSQVPVIGINRGGLGFLADVSPEHLQIKLSAVLNGEFVVDDRFLLYGQALRKGVEIGSSTALNDVVVHAGTMSRMMEFDLRIDGEFVYSQRSDGLIVASPTGSTAYALSAGGPIMHPHLDAIVIVPMFPHTLTSRPLVVRGSSTIEVVIGHTTSRNPQFSCDSQVDVSLRAGDVVQILKYPHPLRLIYPRDHSFYEACRSKLDWASRLGGSTPDQDADGG
jgi:NAD+ kinase